MTTAIPSHLPQQGEQTLSSLTPSLSYMSTLWVPLDETTQQWAAFAKSAITFNALLAAGTAFHGLAWEMKALHHYTWAANERRRRRSYQEVRWLERAVQDLDCTLDQWQQALSWLVLACNDQQQQALTCQQAMRHLIDQASLHQERRRMLHRQLLEEYTSARQQERESHTLQSEKGR